jgi:CBS domain-containing protein
MNRVADILAAKGSRVYSVAAETMVYEAIARMVDHNIGALLVLDQGKPAGIFTERDHLRRVTLPNRDPKFTPVRQVMTHRMVCVEPAKSIEHCMGLMTEERIRHLLVIEDERVVGMISIGDLVKHVSVEQEIEIRHLTQYITGAV